MDEPHERLNAPAEEKSSLPEPHEAASQGLREVPPQAPRKGFWRRHPWLMGLSIAAVAGLVALTVALSMAARRFEPFLHERIIASLAEHFHTKVELDSFHVSVRHGEQAEFGLWATGNGLRIWPPNLLESGQTVEIAAGTEPLIRLDEFSFHVPLRWEQRQFLKIPEVRLKGLSIHVPPKSERERNRVQAAGNDQVEAPGPGKDAAPQPGGRASAFSNVLVERVVCDRAEVVLETDKPDKLPMTFAIAHLKLRNLMAGKPVEFEAELTNPKPTGEIRTEGKFGPWAMDDPGQSPVEGTYRFQHANLGEFKGIAGILSSNGSYKGTLQEISVAGETMVPDFRLTQFGGKLPLHTNFQARVDGTNGDTWLDRVDAMLGTTRFTTSGKVVRVKLKDTAKPDASKPNEEPAETGFVQGGQKAGHVIDVKVDVPHGRMEDFMRLVSKAGNPPITGVVATRATLHIPPGDDPVNKRMKLDGNFKLDNAVFTNEKVQGRVVELSMRAQGHPDQMKHADPKSTVWQMQGDFHMANGVIALPNLVYMVQGAQVQLQGTYSLDGEVSMDGTARMDATVSHMVGGWKGFLLKPADRFFEKDGAGTQVPIRIRGTKEQPDFSVDFGRMKTTSPERPGEKP
jgi:hypothetical protein